MPDRPLPGQWGSVDIFASHRLASDGFHHLASTPPCPWRVQHWVPRAATAKSRGENDDCRAYWGTHGCCLLRGHDGPHWCDCAPSEAVERGVLSDAEQEDGEVGGPPYYGPETDFYGEDAPLLSRQELPNKEDCVSRRHGLPCSIPPCAGCPARQ